MTPSLRLVLKSPVAILTLALGIGANTAIFTVANALLLRPLPYAHPDRLVLISSASDGGALSWPRVRLMIAQSREFAGLAAFTREAFNLTGRDDPEQVPSARVSWNFFDILGVPPAQGRAFLPAEDQPGGDSVAIVTDAFHARHPDSRLTLDGKDYTVIGVLPPDFHFLKIAPAAEIYTTRVYEFNLVTPAQVQSGVGYLDCLARLRPGVALATAQAEVNTLDARYRAENPTLPDATRNLTLRVGDLRDETVANIRPTLLLLFGAVALVLLIACANVASLLLSSALGRRREIAVRMAVGATRASIVRQLFAESLTLALAGGFCGALLSAWGTNALARLGPESLPGAAEIHADASVLAFTIAVSGLAGILFGLAPALQLSRPDLNAVLRVEGRGVAGGRRRNFLRGLLVVAQVALSMVLVVGAGLLFRNFVQLRAASPGFQPHGILTMNVTLPPARYARGQQMISFYDELVTSVRALPGVEAAAVSSALPVNPIRLSPALPDGQPAVPLMQRPWFNIQTVTPGYVSVLRVPLLRGREFNDHDDNAAPPVALVNETVVRRFWPRDNPVGKHILVGRMPKPVEIVGVLGDIRNNSLASDVQPEICLPFAQLPWASMNLLVRAAGDPRRLAAAVRSRVLAVDREQPVTAVQTMDEVFETAAAQPRFATTLLASLSLLALVLAVIGIYGAIAYSVAERTNEMGIRIALGADRSDILAMVLRQGLSLAAAGIAIGLVAALAVTRLLAGLLYRVSATDPLTFIAAALLFAAVAALATCVPALRATRVDPMTALHYD